MGSVFLRAAEYNGTLPGVGFSTLALSRTFGDLLPLVMSDGRFMGSVDLAIFFSSSFLTSLL
jgi:hypothetical protein